MSDAGLGALVYLVKLLSTLMGDARRWRTMPWMVAVFGVAVVPLGIVSIVLVILQPVAVGAWCTLCLASAFLLLLMIPLALDEVVAMLQFMRMSRRTGRPLLRTFFLGGEVAGATDSATVRPTFWRRASMFWGITPHWNLLLAAALGVWVIATPDVLGSGGVAADSSHVAGALVVVVALVATADVARASIWLNVLLGAWIAVAAWLLDGASSTAQWSDTATGIAIALLALPRPPLRERYGAWTRWVRPMTPARS